jgi:HPt (histidine-containing phosphotransfer) domain-containing protein
LSKPFTAQQLYQALLAAVPAPVNTSGEKAVFDPSRLDQLAHEIGVDSVIEMVADFVNELPDRVTEIRRLHTGGQWPELKRAAHSLKGLFLLFGFQALADYFQAIEESAVVSDAAQVSARLEQFNAQSENALERLHDWMDSQKPATGEPA